MIFNYRLRTKIILIAVLVALVIGVIIIIRENSSRNKDLQMVSQVRVFADGLERYYHKFDAYPASDKILVTEIEFISDQGINQEGDIVYFESGGWVDEANYSSNGEEYAIDFSVANRWLTWGIDSGKGGTCRVVTNIAMKCLAIE